MVEVHAINMGLTRLDKVPSAEKADVVELINTLRPRQNGLHFPDDIFKCIFVDENVWISIKISLRFVPNGPIYNIPALVQILTPTRRQTIIWTNDG